MVDSSLSAVTASTSSTLLLLGVTRPLVQVPPSPGLPTPTPMPSKKGNLKSESIEVSRKDQDSSNLQDHGLLRVFMEVHYLPLGVMDLSCFGIGRQERLSEGLK